jgi:hypothetical protein
MTVKQLAERLGVDVKKINLELYGRCKLCVKTGGTEEPCRECTALVSVDIGG